jgi:hypothetical protein
MQQGRITGAVMIAVVLALISTACGGGGNEADDEAVTANGNADDVENTTDDGEGTSLELHPSISNLPLPAGYEIPFAADAYTADQDERETVVQLVVLSQPSDEVAAFLLAELPAAGFTLLDRSVDALVDESDIVPGVGAMVFFENPDGVPGQITINPQPDPPGGTSLNINFYRAGDYSS